ncbi:MAG: DUF86 domain-containing protein [Anaerolineae bacterium]|jgi:uncharacterized protein YutE (UPF0331/DUF86 family)|nr:DUF86 domain-containing protein [Anaerolineae bacterium]MDH7473552.1 DUF86 domain-containing protein [Anaerolineae bacterium]
MIDTGVILERLDALQEYVDKLRPFQSQSPEQLLADENYRDYWAVQRGLTLAAQCVADVSSHLVAGLRLGRAQDYAEAIRLLARGQILPKSFAERLSRIAGFRNVLIHEYLAIEPLKVYEALQNLADLEAFIDHVHDFLRREGYLVE